MTERILTLLRQLGITPSRFADEIGVQRSAMSHLVSGRNNPSLEFITRVLKRYPQVSADWLLSGSGPMMRSGSEPEPLQPVPGTEPGPEPSQEMEPDLFRELSEPEAIREEPRASYETPAVGKKRAEKVFIVFNDKTFRELDPEKD